MRFSVLFGCVASLVLASCTTDDQTFEVRLSTCTTVEEAVGTSADDVPCTTCTVTWPVATETGDPTQDDGYDPDDDTPLTEGPEPVEPGPITTTARLSENQMLALAGALGVGRKAGAPGTADPAADGMTGDVVIADAPGCNGYPDTVCTTHCCALHDICYDKNKCTWKSWCGLESAACAGCNLRVATCIAAYGLFGCQLGNPPPCKAWKCGCDKHECYDAKTKKHYCAASC